jgi:hypothetical protein
MAELAILKHMDDLSDEVPEELLAAEELIIGVLDPALL